MKRVFALMIALLMLILCACGQKTAPAQGERDAAVNQQDQTAEITADGYYVEEKTTEDGTHLTIYRNGGPEGPIVKGFVDYPDGTHSEERYDSEGKLEYMTWDVSDGSVFEVYYYPSGNVAKNISKMADGSYYETHHLDNGSFDEATGVGYDGTITYQKSVSVDGYVEEKTFDIEEDGSSWDTMEMEDGTIVKTHYGPHGALLEQIQDNETTGDHTEITYYENGNEKTRDSYHAESKQRVYLEYYEDNSVKYSLIEGDNGSKNEERINEAGYTTYYFENFNNTKDCEFFANDTGELIKYVEDGTVYEGDAIPGTARDMFYRVRKVAATDVSTTQGADGSSSTTTTYADGSTMTSGVNADGTFTSGSTSANGDEYVEEYYPNGKLKHVVSKAGDMFQEMLYDEDGYWIYLHQVIPGYELEITCDETGKVNKVLVNGVEQTNIEDIVKDMFFRSW